VRHGLARAGPHRRDGSPRFPHVQFPRAVLV
jgi:hypothetical protein